MCYVAAMGPIVKLAFEHVVGTAAARRRAVFLNGLLGRGSNLRTVARRFIEARPGWDAWLVDLRGHGSSPKSTPEPSLQAAAADVLMLCAGSLVPVAALIGHSLGGKVALEAARKADADADPPGKNRALKSLAHVMTLDSNPGIREPVLEGDSAPAVLQMLKELPATFPNRTAFVEAVLAHGKSRSLAQWLAMNTETAPAGGVRFTLDLAELSALLLSYLQADLWPLIENPPPPLSIHQVIGDRSTSYAPADRARARAAAQSHPQVTVDVLPTDHWVHSEDPEGLLRVMKDRIPD